MITVHRPEVLAGLLAKTGLCAFEHRAQNPAGDLEVCYREIAPEPLGDLADLLPNAAQQMLPGLGERDTRARLRLDLH